MKQNICRGFPLRRLSTAVLALCASVALSALSATGAFAQVVYNSTANPILPAAPLLPAPPAPLKGATDDYFSTLVGVSPTFTVQTIQFFGGVIFEGQANGINNVLNFRFLDQFGSPTVPLVSFPVAFTTSGSFLYTLTVGANGIPANSVVPTQGVLEITTLANSNASGTWALTNTPPSVGFNNPNNGIRSFSLSGSVAAPEPGSAALLLLGTGALPLVGLVRRRRV